MMRRNLTSSSASARPSPWIFRIDAEAEETRRRKNILDPVDPTTHGSAVRGVARLRNELLATLIAVTLIYQLATIPETMYKPTTQVLAEPAIPEEGKAGSARSILPLPTINSTNPSSQDEDGMEEFNPSNFSKTLSSQYDGSSPGRPNLFPNTMCPNMVPNPNVWATLFQLARMELDFPKDQIIAKRVDGRAFENFFKFNAGGLTYTSPDSKSHTAYLRLFKAGNDQIRFNLVDMLKSGGGNVMDRNTIHELKLTNQTCVVTAVRDPIERFLSGYNEVEYRREVRVRENGDDDGPPYTRLTNGTTDRFEQYLRDFLGGPKSSGMYQLKKTGIEEITHVFSMTGILYGLHRIKECIGDEIHLTAYLPSLHNLDEEFPSLLSKTCGLDHVKTFEKQYTHPSQLDQFNFYSAAKRVWRNEGAMSRALCLIHALDYACFDSLPVPSICQSVYTGQRFQNNLAQASSKTGNIIPAWVNTHSRHAWAEMASKPGWRDPACGRGNYA